MMLICISGDRLFRRGLAPRRSGEIVRLLHTQNPGRWDEVPDVLRSRRLTHIHLRAPALAGGKRNLSGRRMMNGSLFERMGGFARVRLIVADFYERVLESERLARYFEGIDMRRQIDHQTKFISSIMGGPASFTNEQIARSHARLDVTADDFEEIRALIRETLEDFGVADADVRRVDAHVLAMRDHIVAPAAVSEGMS
jgi:hemoglobin